MTPTRPRSAPDKDARPILSSVTTRLILAIGLTVASAPALAQDLFRNPTASVAARGDAALLSAIDQWNALRASDTLPFSSYAAFLIAHPGWPGEAALRKAAERNLRPDVASPSQVIAYFSAFPAQAPAGDLRLAEAFEAVGRRSDAELAARRAWTAGALSNDDEARLMSRFGPALTPLDQDARMERLLWQRATASAARQLSLTSAVRQPLFDARVAMQARSADAATKSALMNSAASGDAGYLADRANWLRATGQDYAARTLLGGPRALTAKPLDVQRWYELLLSHAKAAATARQWQAAYDIARQVDDAYAPGVAVRDRPFGERDAYTSLVWLAGSTALERLGRPLDALPLFERYARAAKSPQTQSKGLYWAGRAAEAAGRRDLANADYRQAAALFDQFYGQLASERAGVPLTVPLVTRTIEVSAAERAAFDGREIVRAATLLGQRGDWAAQSLFVRQIASAAATDMDHVLTVELSRRIGRPDLAVMTGRSAGINGLRDYVRAGFPIVPVASEDANSWTIVHAISRQESQFDRKIVSHAGARGLMQLMPGTAREIAGKIGVGWSASRLDDPTYNIQLGSWYFGRLMDRWNGNYVLAVASYNAGAGNVAKWVAANGDPRLPGVDVLDWIEAIPFSETRGYVQNVLQNAVVYDLLDPRGRTPPRYPLSVYLGKASAG